MRYPKFLKQNGVIGFVAPAFGAATEPYFSSFKNACKIFEQKGHSLIFGPNIYKGDGIGISTSPVACGEELTEYYCSRENDVLLSMGGGELMCETVDYINFEKIKSADPKWYMGYSDNTNFTFLLNTLCDTAAIYGPCAPAFGMKVWHKAIWDAYSILKGEANVVSGYDLWEKESLKNADNPLEPYNDTEKKLLQLYLGSSKCGEIELSGRLLGGCLDCLTNLVGTKYDNVKAFNEKYSDDGVIWFLESCDLNVFSIRRALWQLSRSGWFDNAKGFIIGRPLCFGQEMFGLDQYNAVIDVIGELGVPIIMDADIGHLPPMIPIVSGAYCDVTVKENVTIEYKYV